MHLFFYNKYKIITRKLIKNNKLLLIYFINNILL